jgi:hypothetical protein
VNKVPRAGLVRVRHPMRDNLLISRAFAELSKLTERECVLRPVSIGGKVQQEVLEVAPRISRSWAAKRGALHASTSFQCPKCGFCQVMLEDPPKAGFFRGILVSDVPHNTENAFVMGGDVSDVELCVSSAIWAKIGRSKETKQVSSQRILMVAESDFEHAPELRKLENRKKLRS